MGNGAGTRVEEMRQW